MALSLSDRSPPRSAADRQEHHRIFAVPSARGNFFRASQKSSPSPDQRAKAIHSARVKLPGTAGITFIAMIAAETAAPQRASNRPPDVFAGTPGRDRARNAAQAVNQPTPTA